MKRILKAVRRKAFNGVLLDVATAANCSAVLNVHSKHASGGTSSPIESLITASCSVATNSSNSSKICRASPQKKPVQTQLTCPGRSLRRAGVDTATAMKIVGHRSEKMWKRYNVIEETDLVNAASKLNTYLQTNTVLTPADSDQVAGSLPG